MHELLLVECQRCRRRRDVRWPQLTKCPYCGASPQTILAGRITERMIADGYVALGLPVPDAFRDPIAPAAAAVVAPASACLHDAPARVAVPPNTVA